MRMVRFRIVSAALLLGAAILACASPLGSQSLDQAATAVAQTLSAVSPAAPQPTAPANPSPLPSQQPAATPAVNVLPHSIYYLNNDQGGLMQVFRLASDGKTVQQITFEPARVD